MDEQTITDAILIKLKADDNHYSENFKMHLMAQHYIFTMKIAVNIQIKPMKVNIHLHEFLSMKKKSHSMHSNAIRLSQTMNNNFSPFKNNIKYHFHAFFINQTT